MAPALAVPWGPEGPPGPWPGPGHLVLVGALASSSAALLLLSLLLLLLCAGCHGQKKKNTANIHPGGGDHENLMNGVLDKEKFSQSVDSPGTDHGVGSSHNGDLTTGTVLTDTQDTSLHLSEEMLSSQSELRSSKCPQDRELPSIPPNSTLEASGDSTYEVVKEMAPALRDLSVEDSLYETVKELKAPPPNSTAFPAPRLRDPAAPGPRLDGPCTLERGPLCAGVEYASVDLKKKSRHSADMEARRRSARAGSGAGPAGQTEETERWQQEEEEEEEEEKPPPVPEKVLDENDNQPLVLNGLGGPGMHNGELHSPCSPSPQISSLTLSDKELSAVYSTVGAPSRVSVGLLVAEEEDKEHDYSSIAELKGLIPASSSSDLYATVRDVYPEREASPPASANPNPGYETVSLPKTGSAGEGQELRPGPQAEPDYETFGELGLNRETSRL